MVKLCIERRPPPPAHCVSTRHCENNTTEEHAVRSLKRSIDALWILSAVENTTRGK